MKLSVKLFQERAGNGRTIYKVKSLKNLRKPKVGEFLEKKEVDKLISDGVVVKIVEGR